MGLKLQTHKSVKRGDHVVTTAVAPYVRLSNGEQVIFIQHGKFWSENPRAPEIKDPPQWAVDQANALEPKVKKEVGWGEEANVQNLDSSERQKATGGADPKPVGETNVDIPEDWATRPAAERRAWASAIAGRDIATVAEGDPIIGEYLAETLDEIENED